MNRRISARTAALAVAAVVAVFAVVPFAARAATLYVDAVATGTQDGSQAYPFRTIKQAIDVAQAGDTIHVVAGTYSPSTNGEAFPIAVKNGIMLEGDDPRTTILNAEGTARVVVFDSTTTGTGIKKFTIAGGVADRGGGIYCNNSYTLISNNFICYNSVSNAGGGIECNRSGATIQNNVIHHNSAGDEGGGIDCDVQSAPKIVNNTIVDNHADGDKGGGVNCDDGSCPSLINNIIHHNSGYGVFEESEDSDPILKSNDLYDNDSHEYFDCTLGDLGTDMDTADEINSLANNSSNMVRDPRYLNHAGGDYRLTISSHCIDGGTNDSAPSDDVLGRTRPFDVVNVDHNGSTTNFDIGAFEYVQDLSAPNGDFWPKQIILTQTLWLWATVTNSGDDTVNSTQIQFYLCPTMLIDTGTCPLVATLDVPQLARGESYSAATSLALTDIQPRTYYVGWLVDSGNAVQEWDENNAFFAADTLEVDAINRDLAITDGSFQPADTNLGDSIWVNAWVENIGNWDTESTSVLQFYLTDDLTIDPSSDLLLASEVVPALAPGGASYHLISAQVDNVAPRPYYIGWLVDAQNQVAESDEANEFFTGDSLLVRAHYGFDAGTDGWTTHNAALVFEPPLPSVAPGALTLQALTNTNTFGYWQTPAEGIKIVPGSLYHAQFTVSSDQTDRSRVPTLRLRANTADAQIAHILRIDSTGAGELSPPTSPTPYNLYFSSPSTLSGSAETTISLSFDMLNFDPADAADALLRLEDLTLTRFSVEDVGSPTDVHTYEFMFSAEDWAFASVPAVFSAPAASIAEECLILKALTNTDTFGYWASPTDDIVMDATQRFFRATFSVRSDQADRARVPTLRLRLYDSQNQMSVEQMITSSGAGANSPAAGNQDYELYYLTRGEMDQRGLCAAFDLLNFSPDDSTTASLKLDSAAVHLLNIPASP